MNEVEKFIIKFNLFGKQVKKCFTEGNCYWFAHILHTRFPGSYIMINNVENHFACKIEDELYDITGKCADKYKGEWVDWNYYQMADPTHSKRIIECCIEKVR